MINGITNLSKDFGGANGTPVDGGQALVDQFVSAQPCAREPHWPFAVRAAEGKGGVILHGSVRIESFEGWDGAGGRTDLHDILGLAWAAALRASGAASSEVWIDVGWGGSPEVGSRFMFFNQPYSSALAKPDADIALERLLAHTAWVAHGLLDAFRMGGNRAPEWTDAKPPSWVPKLADLVDDVEAGIWITRKNPDWEYFVDKRNAISIVKIGPKSRPILNHLFDFYRPRAVTTGGQHIISTAGLVNCVSEATAMLATEIFRRVEGRGAAKWAGPASLPRENAILTLPLESHCVFVGARTIVAFAEPSGILEFDQARQSWDRRTADEAAIFNIGVQWRWADKLDPARFEELVEALLTEEPGLQWVRAAGPAYERDQGRDLVAAWLTPPAMGQRLTGAQAADPVETRKILVQVKVRSKTVGKSDVRDVRDTLERHDANGFLLVTHPAWSNDLFNYLESLASKGLWVNLWGPLQLEERLRRRPAVARRFADLVTVQPD